MAQRTLLHPPLTGPTWDAARVVEVARMACDNRGRSVTEVTTRGTVAGYLASTRVAGRTRWAVSPTYAGACHGDLELAHTSRPRAVAALMASLDLTAAPAAA